MIECRRNLIAKASHKALRVSQSLQTLVPDHASAIHHGLPYSGKSHPPAVPLTHTLPAGVHLRQFPPSPPKALRMSAPNLSDNFQDANSFISGNYDIPTQPRNRIRSLSPCVEAPSKGLGSTYPPKALHKPRSPNPSWPPSRKLPSSVSKSAAQGSANRLPLLAPPPPPPTATMTTTKTETTNKVSSCRAGQQGVEAFPQATVKEGIKDETDRKRAMYLNKSTGNSESDFETIHTWLGNRKPPGTVEIDSPLYLVLQGNMSQEPRSGGAGGVEKTNRSGGKVGSSDGDYTSESAPRLGKVRRSNSDHDLSSRGTVMRKGTIRVYKDPLDTISTQRQLSAEDLTSVHNRSNSPQSYLNHDQHPSSNRCGTDAAVKHEVGEGETSIQPTLADEAYDYVRRK